MVGASTRGEGQCLCGMWNSSSHRAHPLLDSSPQTLQWGHLAREGHSFTTWSELHTPNFHSLSPHLTRTQSDSYSSRIDSSHKCTHQHTPRPGVHALVQAGILTHISGIAWLYPHTCTQAISIHVTKVHPYVQLLPKQALLFLEAHERKRATYHLLPRVQGQSIETEGWRQGGSKAILSLYLQLTPTSYPTCLGVGPRNRGLYEE